MMWPRDLLPQKIPYARIMIFTYNSNVALNVSESGIRGHANSLLDLLQGLREETDTASLPLILVGHSLGGLVMKQALVQAKQNDRVQIAVNVATFFSGNLRNDLVESLKGNSKYLAQLSADFAHQYENYDFLSVIETRGLMRAPIRTVVVDPTSAVIGLAGHREQVLELDRDHRQICKFIQDSDFNRVARHLKRLADAATRNAISANPIHSDSQGSPQSLSSAPDVGALPGAMRLFSNLDSMHRTGLIGQSETLRWLELFVENPNEQYVLFKGAPGTGKSAIVYEFASRCQGNLSIFWFCAESLEAIQSGFKEVSHRISLERYSTSSQNRQQPFRDWLSNEHHAKWIVVFDNAHHGLDLRNLLPYKGGKVIITSRHTDVKTDASFITKDVPPLLPAEATQLFLAKWELHHHTGGEYHTIPSSAVSVLEDLHDRLLAVVLAASCVASMRFDSAPAHLQILQEEESSDAGHLDEKIWKWVCHLLEELNPGELNLLTLLAMFDSTCISDEFLDSISGGNAGEDTVFPATNTAVRYNG